MNRCHQNHVNNPYNSDDSTKFSSKEITQENNYLNNIIFLLQKKFKKITENTI